MLLGGGGIGDEVVLGIDDAAVEAFLATVDTHEHKGGRKELERPTACEALVPTLREQLAACAPENRDAEPATMPALKRGTLPPQRVLGIISGRSQAQQGRRGDERAAQHGSA